MLENAAVKTKVNLTKVSPLEVFEAAFAPAKKLAKAQVSRIREKNPELSDIEIIEKLEKRFLAQVTATGGAAGAFAAAPVVGTPVALGTAVADVGTTTQMTAVHTYAVLDVLDLELEDVDLERALIMTVMLGGSGSTTINKVAERTGAHWGRQLTKKVPAETLKQVNKILGRNFVTKYGTKQGILVIGKVAPFGIGAAVGTGLSLMFGVGMLKAVRKTIFDVAVLESGIDQEVLEHLKKDIKIKEEDVEEGDIIDGDVIDVSYEDEAGR